MVAVMVNCTIIIFSYSPDLEDSEFDSGEASLSRQHEESKNRMRNDVRKQLTTISKNTLRQEGGKLYALEDGELLAEEARKSLNNGFVLRCCCCCCCCCCYCCCYCCCCLCCCYCCCCLCCFFICCEISVVDLFTFKVTTTRGGFLDVFFPLLFIVLFVFNCVCFGR